MPMPQTRPQHLKHAVEAHLKLAPARALDRLTRLDPVLGSFVAQRQQQLVAMLDRLPIASTVFAEIAVEQLRAMIIALDMQRSAFDSAFEEMAAEDDEAANEAMARSEPPYGVIS
ncbi:MAG: hypothetical protein ACTHLZ_09415 [Tepidisphaeraceae bacterium]